MQRGARVIAIILLLIGTGVLFYWIGNYKGYIEALDDFERELLERYKEVNHE